MCAGCGEPMQFENKSSNQTVPQDEPACNQELSQHVSGLAYAQETMARVDPMQTCMERKGWSRVDHPSLPSNP
ncbi:MAG TPA: hypothetical protein VLD60_13115 [Nitrospira sp.]|nr:hypothetical protein [Nitrospira sp.]